MAATPSDAPAHPISCLRQRLWSGCRVACPRTNRTSWISCRTLIFSVFAAKGPTNAGSTRSPTCVVASACNRKHVLTHLEDLAASDPTHPTYPYAVIRLRHLCRTTGLVPTSCRIPKGVVGVSADPISQSNFSDVFRGMLDDREVAIKVLRLHEDDRGKVKQVSTSPLQSDVSSWKKYKAYLHELVIWQHLRHLNIVPFIGTSQKFQVSLVSEWMPGGTVCAFLCKNPGHDRVALVSFLALLRFCELTFFRPWT
jgi:hypothetical protein